MNIVPSSPTPLAVIVFIRTPATEGSQDTDTTIYPQTGQEDTYTYGITLPKNTGQQPGNPQIKT
jgi:hypothetical protein